MRKLLAVCRIPERDTSTMPNFQASAELDEEGMFILLTTEVGRRLLVSQGCFSVISRLVP